MGGGLPAWGRRPLCGWAGSAVVVIKGVRTVAGLRAGSTEVVTLEILRTFRRMEVISALWINTLHVVTMRLTLVFRT
jgi:hypothetical protein